MASFGIPLCIFYVVLLPTYFAYRLYQHRHTLHEPAVFARFGSLYRLFRPQVFYYTIISFYKRLAFVVVNVFFSRMESLQIILYAVTCWGFGAYIGNVRCSGFAVCLAIDAFSPSCPHY